MKALLLLALLAISAMSCVVPETDHTQGYVITPGAFAGLNCNSVNLTNTAHFLIISTNSFLNSTGFDDVTIPANTRTIEDYAFANTSVKHAKFLGSLTAVSDLAFDHLCSIAVQCPKYDIRIEMAGEWQVAYRKLAACDLV